MKQRTLGIIGTGVISLASLVGCASTHKEQRGISTEPRQEAKPTAYAGPNIMKDLAVGRVTNKESKYNEKAEIIWGTPYFSKPNQYQKPNELGLMIYALNETSRETDRDNKTIAHDPVLFYIPKQVTLENGQPASEVILDSSGPRGLKAKRKKYDTANIQTGVLSLTEEDEKFGLETVLFNKQEFYVPLIPQNQTEELTATPFFMIPAKGAKIITSPNGTISIRNPGNIYWPIANSPSYYGERKTAEEKVKELMQQLNKEDAAFERKTSGQTKEVK